MIETNRLILREYTIDDLEDLYKILSDPITMAHYPKTYDLEMTKYWIEWSINNYKKYGFGLWAIILKENGKFIGDCGLTIQNIDNEQLPEIGYHINRLYWKNGYAKEAATAVRDWVFNNTNYDTIYSYMNTTNIASYKTALSIGMKRIKEYIDKNNEHLYVYAITRKEWQKYKL